MNTTGIVAFAFAVLGIGIFYVPALLLRHSQKLPRKDFVQAYPNFAWLRWWEPTFGIFSVFVVLLSYAVFMNLFQSRTEYIYVAGTLLAGMAIPNGFFTVLTGICPVPTKPRYLYVYGDKTRLIGLLQILSALVLIAFAAFLAFRLTSV